MRRSQIKRRIPQSDVSPRIKCKSTQAQRSGGSQRGGGEGGCFVWGDVKRRAAERSQVGRVSSRTGNKSATGLRNHTGAAKRHKTAPEIPAVIMSTKRGRSMAGTYAACAG